MTVLFHMYTQSDKIRLGAASRAQDQVPSRPAPPVRRSGVSERRSSARSCLAAFHWRYPPPALCRPSVWSLRASRGRALRSHAGTGERGVAPNTSSCLPHEQGSPPQNALTAGLHRPPPRGEIVMSGRVYSCMCTVKALHVTAIAHTRWFRKETFKDTSN